jgi:hypothetical protein
MNNDLRTFLLSMLWAVLPALMVVVVTAFLTTPFLLGYHPGERIPVVPVTVRHMT